MISLDPKFVDAHGMLLAGIRRHHAMSTASTTIPEQWQEFRSSGLRASRAPRAYGVMCGVNGDDFEYMTALEVESFEGLPTDMGRMRVPPQQYAVFYHDDHVSTIGSSWQRIWSEWLPSSGYEDAVTPAFELYDRRFDPETGNGGCEIWFPVKRSSRT